MNGYDAQDMATQGADGFRKGYQAGYADAKPAAAQEAVAWQSRFVGGEWGSCSREHHDHVKSVPKEWPDYEVRQLYAAPVAAAPVEAVNYAELYGMACEAADWAGFVFRMDPVKHILNLHPKGSAAAAPGIDLIARLREILTQINSDTMGDDYLNLSCDALSLIDASPKDSSAERARFEAWATSRRYSILRHTLEPEQYMIEEVRYMWRAWRAALQATSAEVGA